MKEGKKIERRDDDESGSAFCARVPIKAFEALFPGANKRGLY